MRNSLPERASNTRQNSIKRTPKHMEMLGKMPLFVVKYASYMHLQVIYPHNHQIFFNTKALFCHIDFAKTKKRTIFATSSKQERDINMMDAFFRTHQYLVEHTNAPLRRQLMDEINWQHPLIGIKGARGVGKTTFLLQYAKEHYGSGNRKCLYINMNNFYFQQHGLISFATEYHKRGGEVLLIDQVFKEPNWSQQLRECRERLPKLKIVFTGSSVMRLKEENPELGGIAESYNLRGLSLREFINLQTGLNLPTYSLQDIITHHERIAREILPMVQPYNLFKQYVHHGFYPFYREDRNYSENLLKTMNMMIEVDILFIKQMDLKNLSKLRKLLYLLTSEGPQTPNVSQLAVDIDTSRQTVMNYIKYLSDARLINIIYPEGEDYPKKPSKVMMHNSNLMYAIYPIKAEEQQVMETFMVNSLWKDHTVSQSTKDIHYTIDGTMKLKVTDALMSKARHHTDTIYARYNTEIGRDNQIPLWLFGFLY